MTTTPGCPACSGPLVDASPDRYHSGWATCRTCRRVFALDRTSDAHSVAGRARFVERPPGIILLRSGPPGAIGYRDAPPAEGEDAAIRFRPREKTLAFWVLGGAGAFWGLAVAFFQFCLRPLLGIQPAHDDPAFWLGASALLLVGAPLAAFIGLRRNTFTVRVGRGLVVAERGGRESFRMKREAITQVACFSEIVSAGGGSARMRCDLVALNARGTATPMLEDVPPTHALFAEVWLESVLGLADVADDREM